MPGAKNAVAEVLTSRQVVVERHTLHHVPAKDLQRCLT